MRNLIERNGVNQSVDSPTSSLAFARAEAIKRGFPVTLCRSTGAETGTPACSSDAAWNTGWLAFVDFGGDGSFDANSGDVLLRVQGSLEKNGALNQSRYRSLVFQPTGTSPSRLRPTFPRQRAASASASGEGRVLFPAFAHHERSHDALARELHALLEVMIVVAIVAILAAVAYPSYLDSVRKSRRAEARAQLMEAAQYMQRFSSQNDSFSRAIDADTDMTLPPALTSVPRQGARTYTIGFEVLTPTSVALTPAHSIRKRCRPDRWRVTAAGGFDSTMQACGRSPTITLA